MPTPPTNPDAAPQPATPPSDKPSRFPAEPETIRRPEPPPTPAKSDAPPTAKPSKPSLDNQAVFDALADLRTRGAVSAEVTLRMIRGPLPLLMAAAQAHLDAVGFEPAPPPSDDS